MIASSVWPDMCAQIDLIVWERLIFRAGSTDSLVWSHTPPPYALRDRVLICGTLAFTLGNVHRGKQKKTNKHTTECVCARTQSHTLSFSALVLRSSVACKNGWCCSRVTSAHRHTHTHTLASTKVRLTTQTRKCAHVDYACRNLHCGKEKKGTGKEELD